MQGIDDVISGRLNQVKPVADLRTPFIGDGTHVLIVESIETYYDKKLVEAALGNQIAGLSVRATFSVERSTCHPVGSKVCKTWNLFRPSKFPSQPTDADRWVDFVCKLQGIAVGQHQASMQAMLKTRAEGGQLEAQIARGVRINATGVKANKPTVRRLSDGTTQETWFVNVQWDTFTTQDNNLVTQTRAQLDQTSPYTYRQEQVQAVAPAPAPVPQQAPTQYLTQQPATQATTGFLSILPPR